MCVFLCLQAWVIHTSHVTVLSTLKNAMVNINRPGKTNSVSWLRRTRASFTQKRHIIEAWAPLGRSKETSVLLVSLSVSCPAWLVTGPEEQFVYTASHCLSNWMAGTCRVLLHRACEILQAPGNSLSLSYQISVVGL